MELVEGESLADLLRERGAMPSTAVLSIAKQLSRALEVAHAQGVIHGDLKPQNLLVSTDGVVKVSDFGVARLVRRGVSGASARRDERHDARIAGAVIGTPEYMAPEALLGEDAGVRGDIYAAGVVLHECLTGETPFRADTPSAFFARKLDDGSESPREPVEPGDDPIARRLGAVMRAMTAPAADARPASAAAVSELLSFGE
jgi:serine/threonine-protein kinase